MTDYGPPREVPYGPGHPDFDAKMQERWRQGMRDVVPGITDEQLDYLHAEASKMGNELRRATEMAPRWALCNDCFWERLNTCPQESQCWAPLKTHELRRDADSA